MNFLKGFEVDWLTLLGLLVIGTLAYFITLKVIDFQSSSKRKRLSKILSDDVEEKSNMRKKYPFLNYFIPSFVMEKATEYNADYTKKIYTTYFLAGTLIGILSFFVYFRAFQYLIPLSLLVGVLATNIKLHIYRRDYLRDTDQLLSIYMSSFTTAYGTFGNVKNALASILPSLDNPLKDDIEQAYLLLSEGKTISQAFYAVNQKYSFQVVKLFHDQLQALEDSGSTDTNELREVVEQMEEKAVYRNELARDFRSKFKDWKLFVIMIYSSPFIFVIVSYENYELLVSSAVVNVVLFMVTMYIAYVYYQLTQIETYDPTETS